MENSSLAVVFDWDNTLVDIQGNISNAVNYTLGSMGCNNKAANKNSYKSERNYMIDLSSDQWEKVNQIYRYLDSTLLQNITLNQGVGKMLQKLKSHNIYLAIVSNKKNINLRKEVAYLKLESYFKRVVGSCDTAEDKPSAIPLLFALEESILPISRENVFFVGDSITDILCAQNANCLPIIYGQSISGYEDLLCFQHFDKLTDFIIKYLKNR
ncbi:HAD family hydrolase [Wolbachia endosymbiont of Dirofilaria (Dirofilaria) immitis]|uniref:HAD family hydrolase n=1 Tax=Wolbachia endosymbiont of Dirofilaria (Dirofilaria) immitis TaxID=1812115 RepID=UPI00158A310A|nr:HAD-IA family hydrolase [Wolbachia endosymbiont of Dirofilaria (Dirofilaria) immitis]QKX02055.1 HAD-IA family hydrolase [Wolbachia endosymbiont of Dirofilaria (Dirofilaria) immitis]